MFDEAKFLHDLDQEIIKGSFYQHEEAFAVFSSVFRDVVDRHAPSKVLKSGKLSEDGQFFQV